MNERPAGQAAVFLCATKHSGSLGPAGELTTSQVREVTVYATGIY